ncbi:hypothetical protein [Oxynema aestuarii]|jgi:hypothetical protein|uniref:Polymerase nucleotidyl transferase domain-containing protein n=1 Tax=Oxynema aestuarii AP17 TaxID=2064643 RepID=A0A6H1TV49_9CYAN|nr:hypothetical protein [Oxynema aestuarii]QIZ70295.1 hypothetical protein HCG48_06650 [Oxynema aestuarii AP17]
MSRLVKMGRLWPTDARGYLINECGTDRIASPWTELVEVWKALCLKALDDRAVSLYLRGSVPRGEAIARISDLDGVVILQENYPLEAARSQLQAIGRHLQQRYQFCHRVETSALSETALQISPSSPAPGWWSSLLKTQGLCVWGRDFNPILPPVKPDRALVTYAVSLKDDLVQTLDFLRNLSPGQLNFDRQVRRRCRWICRRLVRAGFELVMVREGIYTRDLYLSYEYFARAFPQWERQMYKAVQLAIFPTGDRAGLLLFLAGFGAELADRTEGILDGDR